jgi:hypothetical protein
MSSVYEPEDQAGAEARPAESDDPQVDAPEASHSPWWRRRKYQMAVAVGVAAALGTTGVLVTRHMGEGRAKTASKAGAGLVPMPGAAQPSEATAATAAPGTAPSSPGATAGAAGEPAPGLPAQQPPPAVKPAPAKTGTDTPAVTVTNSGSLPKEHHTLRVVSALADLSGQRELAWAADSGHPVGSASCTQKFRFNADSPAGERPTMLLCWRTSANKSVYTIAVDLDRRPSEQASIAVIDRTWSTLR